MNIIPVEVSDRFKFFIDEYMNKIQGNGEEGRQERKYKQYRQRYNEAVKIYNELNQLGIYDQKEDQHFCVFVVDGRNREFVVHNFKICLRNRRIQKSGILKL